MPKRTLAPQSDQESESWETMQRNKKKMTPRQFRDALTRAEGSIPGIKTHVYDGKRFGV
jgi:hypothetical protein